MGGKVYTELEENINVHKYCACIFHTNNKEVWEYINHFTDFNRYTTSLIANYNEKYIICCLMIHFIKCGVLGHLKLKLRLMNKSRVKY
nr:hypothetical protein [uncultured Methanobrevibacter sp.]